MQTTKYRYTRPLAKSSIDSPTFEITVLPIHRAQVLTYLRHADKQLGLLINFNVERLVLGVDRIVNNFGLPRSLRTRSCEIPTDAQ